MFLNGAPRQRLCSESCEVPPFIFIWRLFGHENMILVLVLASLWHASDPKFLASFIVSTQPCKGIWTFAFCVEHEGSPRSVMSSGMVFLLSDNQQHCSFQHPNTLRIVPGLLGLSTSRIACRLFLIFVAWLLHQLFFGQSLNQQNCSINCSLGSAVVRQNVHMCRHLLFKLHPLVKLTDPTDTLDAAVKRKNESVERTNESTRILSFFQFVLRPMRMKVFDDNESDKFLIVHVK